uniref:Uncharacterized protein n=1 Tax=Plectus sambesii TaxID=2011161 RepID=A0A914W3M3_9BILA
MEFIPCAPMFAVLSRRQKPVIQYKTKRWNGTVLEFSYKSASPKDSNMVYYQCIACKKLSNLGRVGGEKSGVAHNKLVNGVIITDPDNTNTPHGCGAGSNTTMAAESEYGQDVVDNIKVKLNTGYGFASKHRALTQNRAYHIIKDNTLDNIHESLRVTKDNGPFLQTYDLSLGREMLIFAISDLDMSLEAEFVLCDGNHKYNPPEFHKPGQLYTLHTIIKGECHPFLFAMKKKVDQDVYRHLFNSL